MRVKIDESWNNVLEKFFIKDYFKLLVEKIRHEYKNYTIYPKGEKIYIPKYFHSTSTRDSKEAHKDSHKAINDDNSWGGSHMDHVKKLAKHVTYKSGTAHKNLN